MGGAQRHEDRVGHAVDEVQDGGEQEAHVPAEADEPVLGVQAAQARLQGQDEEEDGRHEAQPLVLLLGGADERQDAQAQVVGEGRDHGAHPQHGQRRVCRSPGRVPVDRKSTRLNSSH